MDQPISSNQSVRWQYVPVEEERLESIRDELGVSLVIAEVIARLGIEDLAEVRQFLRPMLKELSDPFGVRNLKAAVERIIDARDRNEKLVVFGDYDVDGVTSTALLVSAFRRMGLKPEFVVPRRMEEGYGLSVQAVERVLNVFHPDLLLAVDCGTNSRDEVRELRSRGVDVIIVDHHRAVEGVPDDCIIVNPHLEEDNGRPWTHLSAVGLAFKLVHGILKYLRERQDPSGWEIELKDYLDLVAMGTIADLVPLRDENRILALHGLSALNETRRHGVRALLRIAGMKDGDRIGPMEISFRIGPRINACGRLADAALPVKMLLSGDFASCVEIARQLDDYNRERQDIERRIVEEADRHVEELEEPLTGIVLYNGDWHPGVVGIVASRISRKYNRPVIVLGREGELAKGSGRGIKGLNLVRVLEKCDDILESWGGHPLAVGVSLRREHVAEFQRRFAITVEEFFSGDIPSPELTVAAWIDLDDVNEHFLTELDLLYPFGQGNPEPLFGVRGVELRRPLRVFQELHFRFEIEDGKGRRLFGVAWKKAHALPPLNVPLDFVFRIYRNAYGGRQYLQLEMMDWRPSKQGTQPPDLRG